MENYIQKIISVFTASKHSEKVIEEVHQWLVDKEYSDEKEAALHTLWSETEGKADAGTWASLSNVYNKIGAGQQKNCAKIPNADMAICSSCSSCTGCCYFRNFLLC